MKHDYPLAFEEAWKEYPRREPDNPKLPAFKAWLARVREGVEISTLLAATKGYAASIRSRRKEGTETVLHASTFFGPNERYIAFVPKPQESQAVTPRRVPVTDPDRPIDAAVIARLPAAVREIVAKLAQAKAIS